MNTIQPEDVVLILCEMQPQIVAASRTNAEASLRHAASVLISAAGILGIPVVAAAVQLAPGSEVDLVSELVGHAPVSRSTVGVFDDPAIATQVAATGRKVVALGGVSSEIAILHAALGAKRLGYEVHVLADCCGGLSERTESTAFGQMRDAGAVLSNVSSFLTTLAPDMSTSTGQAVMGALARLWGWGDPSL